MLLELNQVGKREFLANYITRVDAKDKPLLAMIPKGPPVRNMLVEYQADDFEDAADIAVEDGVDASTFDNASPNRVRVQTYAMKVRDTAMVSDLAEEVSDVAGLSKGELAESIMKKLEKVGRSIEAFMCGDQEQQAGVAGKAYKGRGLGIWTGPASGMSVLPIDSRYETPADSRNSTAINSLTQDHVNSVLESSYQKTGKIQNFVLLCGPRLKRRFSKFTQFSTGTAPFGVIRFYGTNFTNVIDDVVDTFRGDYGTVELHTTLWNAHAAFGGSAAANLRRGYLIPLNMMELNYKRQPRVKPLEDRGGGPRFLVDAILAWKVKNPLPFGKFYATTD